MIEEIKTYWWLVLLLMAAMVGLALLPDRFWNRYYSERNFLFYFFLWLAIVCLFIYACWPKIGFFPTLLLFQFLSRNYREREKIKTLFSKTNSTN